MIWAGFKLIYGSCSAENPSISPIWDAWFTPRDPVPSPLLLPHLTIYVQVCALLQMLVPELDQNAVGVKTEPVDGTKLVSLLNQVLEANQAGEEAAASQPTTSSQQQPVTSQPDTPSISSTVKTEVFNPPSHVDTSWLDWHRIFSFRQTVVMDWSAIF